MGPRRGATRRVANGDQTALTLHSKTILRAHAGAIDGLALACSSPGGCDVLVSCSSSDTLTVRLWDVATGAALAQLSTSQIGGPVFALQMRG